MAEDSGQDKTELPSPKRLREAREKGEVPRSKELSSMTLLLGAGLMGLTLGQGLVEDMAAIMSSAFELDRQEISDTSMMMTRLGGYSFEAIKALFGIMAVFLIIVLLTPISIGGWNFSTKALAPKGSRLNPLSGIGRMFSMNSLIELFKAIAKFSLVATFSISVMLASESKLKGLIAQDINVAMGEGVQLVLWAFVTISLSLIIIAAMDVPYQLYSYTKKLKMTLQEVKDEQKNTEGNPQVKGRIRQLQQQASMNRMIANVAEADVIITNPTHYAVAIKYDKERGAAPFLVAKGLNHMAERIKEVAAENEVLVLSSPALARAIYHHTDIDEQVPMGLYQSVAQVLAYVYQINNFKETGLWQEVYPPTESELAIPKELYVEPKD